MSLTRPLCLTLLASLIATITAARGASGPDCKSPGSVAVGRFQGYFLCADPAAHRDLQTIRYDIRQFGTDANLSYTADAAAELAKEGKVSIVPDKTNPNFILLLIAGDANIDVAKTLDVYGIRYKAEDLGQIRREISAEQNYIASYKSTTPYWANMHVVLVGREGHPVYVDVRVHEKPIDSTFLAIDVSEEMMRALGLSSGKSQF